MKKKTTDPIGSAGAALALMRRVRLAIDERGLDTKSAAAAIGMAANTLQGHLRGEHIRSDSALKYENWLAGRPRNQTVFVLPTTERNPDDVVPREVLPSAPGDPWLVVDLFSGCGGLSLGFDLLSGSGHQGQRFFRTILAIDNQAAPIAVFNRNAQISGHTGAAIGRIADLTEFGNGTEFLAFYLRHAAGQHRDEATIKKLDTLASGAFRKFRSSIVAIDAKYLADLALIRVGAAWRKAWSGLDRQALNQTSVIGFHEKLRLPRTGTRSPSLPPILWSDVGPPKESAADILQPSDQLLKSAAEDWDAEVATLEAKREGSGRGQLTASARRIRSFVEFLRSPIFSQVREAWCSWRARRAMLRAETFEDPVFARELRCLYSEAYPVTVLVGGPPCQGFSRIGRGKIRSLREALVHVHGHDEAGDARNLLLQHYVMVLGALRPPIFLFENVQHFQSTVRANGFEFEATDVLAEAIANASDGEAAYAVSSRTIDASKHGVPQARQRFFMAGVLHGRGGEAVARTTAEHCLSLHSTGEVPLSAALAGLPEPDLVGGDVSNRDAMRNQVRVAELPLANGSPGRYASWVRQPDPRDDMAPAETDAHAARAPRMDDAALFALMGPGKRWMDYRADDAPTIQALRDLLFVLTASPREVMKGIATAAGKVGRSALDHDRISDLLARVDGSLPIRLLMEQAGERLAAPHHLLTSNYLAKRDGNHGDWVARLDPSRPSKTIVSHMGKDTYGYIHPSSPRTISVREAARVQTFPDWFSFGEVALTDAFKMIGNAVPPLLSHLIAARIATVLAEQEAQSLSTSMRAVETAGA